MQNGMLRTFRSLGRVLDVIYELCARLAGALLIMLCLLVAFSITARLMGWYGGGATDVAGYVMAAGTFMALASVFRCGGHICVSFLSDMLSPRPRRWLLIFAQGMMFIAAASLAVYLARLAYFSWLFGTRSEGADALPMWIPQLPAALGATLFAIAVLHGALETVFARAADIRPKTNMDKSADV